MIQGSRPLLDHGYLQYVEHWGSDERVIEAARVSTGKGFRGWGTEEEPGDEKLLRYLYEHKHTTPFEMAGLVVEALAPTCVVWEWVRHRTQSYNIQSSRYGPIPDTDYLPTQHRCMAVGGSKQGAPLKGSADLTTATGGAWLGALAGLYSHSRRVYRHGLDAGVPMELARLALTFGRYWKMRASANLLNWLKFLALRMAPEAQWEMRQYANAVGDLIAGLFPRTWALFSEGGEGARGHVVRPPA